MHKFSLFYEGLKNENYFKNLPTDLINMIYKYTDTYLKFRRGKNESKIIKFKDIKILVTLRDDEIKYYSEWDGIQTIFTEDFIKIHKKHIHMFGKLHKLDSYDCFRYEDYKYVWLNLRISKILKCNKYYDFWKNKYKVNTRVNLKFLRFEKNYRDTSDDDFYFYHKKMVICYTPYFKKNMLDYILFRFRTTNFKIGEFRKIVFSIRIRGKCGCSDFMQELEYTSFTCINSHNTNRIQIDIPEFRNKSIPTIKFKFHFKIIKVFVDDEQIPRNKWKKYDIQEGSENIEFFKYFMPP